MRHVPVPPLYHFPDCGMVPAGVLRGYPISVQLGRDSAIARAGAPELEDAVDGFEFGGDRNHAVAPAAVGAKAERRVRSWLPVRTLEGHRIASPFADQLAFHLREAPEQGEHKATVRR